LLLLISLLTRNLVSSLDAMTPWDSIIRFEADDGNIYFAPMPLETSPVVGAKVEAFNSIEDIETERPNGTATIKMARRETVTRKGYS
jgi:hypothetical protein